MRLDLYQAECERIAEANGVLLEEARLRIAQNQPLSKLEQSRLLHVIQVLIENAIVKSKHLLKAANQTIPVSAYDAFASLADTKIITDTELESWNTAIGLRNRIEHDYMNSATSLTTQKVYLAKTTAKAKW